MVTINDLKKFKPKFDYLIGIDSDGTVFDSMNIKHSHCFIDPLINIYNLNKVSLQSEQMWKEINLYSINRGINRFEALIVFFEKLKFSNFEVISNYSYPNLKPIKYLMDLNIPLTDKNLKKLKKKINKDQYSDIRKAISWSLAVNENVKNLPKDMPLISGAYQAIYYLSKHADIIVVSNTPFTALHNDWSNYKIRDFVSLICSQETGSKIDILEAATKEKYDKNKVLMIGDSPSDFYAARKNDISFFPIIPGKEDTSWRFLRSKALSSFFSFEYKHNYENKKIIEFESAINAKLNNNFSKFQ